MKKDFNELVIERLTNAIMLHNINENYNYSDIASKTLDESELLFCNESDYEHLENYEQEAIKQLSEALHELFRNEYTFNTMN